MKKAIKRTITNFDTLKVAKEKLKVIKGGKLYKTQGTTNLADAVILST